MEDEEPVQRGRRSLDVFDPSSDGHEPHTLAEVVRRGQELLESIDRFQAALYGCMTPLTFINFARRLGWLRGKAAEIVETISKARDIVEMDIPLAKRTESDLLFGDISWAPAEGSPGSLSASKVLELRNRALQVGPDELTTYRAEMEKQPKIPGLITVQRRDAARAAVPEEVRETRRARIANLKAAGMNRGEIRRLLEKERAEAAADSDAAGQYPAGHCA